MKPMDRNTMRSQIAHLTTDYTYTVRDPLWRDIPLSGGFKALLSSGAMQKLNRIKQLGPAHLVYPGAVHTRLDHSLGVFHATRLILISLLTRTQRDTGSLISHEGIQAVLAAAMLHDVGHFPFAHALKDSVTAEHEHLGALSIENDRELRSIIEEELKTSVDAVCSIIDASRPNDSEEIGFLRNILSGTLDPDKLDYLSRDALFCGIPYGMQDASYIIRHLMINEDRMRISVPESAIGAVEHLLFAKYAMYRNVYWHQGTRSATAMIKKAVHLALAEGLFAERDLYDRDDESFARLFTRKAHSTPARLFDAVRNNRLLVSRLTLPYLPMEQHRRLYDDGTYRRWCEAEIHRRLYKRYPKLAVHELIIDIPENVSFESDIPIIRESGETVPFSEADELFTPDIVRTFTSSLRKIRIYTLPSMDESTLREAAKGIIQDHES